MTEKIIKGLPWNEYQRQWRLAHPGYTKERDRKRRLANLEKYKERDRKKWAAKDKAEHAAYKREYRKRTPEVNRAIYKRYWENNKLQYAARQAVHRAIRNGKLIRPTSCKNCNVECKPHGHHHNGYEHEHWLDVVWLCVTCHRAAETTCP